MTQLVDDALMDSARWSLACTPSALIASGGERQFIELMFILCHSNFHSLIKAVTDGFAGALWCKGFRISFCSKRCDLLCLLRLRLNEWAKVLINVFGKTRSLHDLFSHPLSRIERPALTGKNKKMFSTLNGSFKFIIQCVPSDIRTEFIYFLIMQIVSNESLAKMEKKNLIVVAKIFNK